MNLKNIKNCLSWIISNNQIKSKNDSNIFMYNNKEGLTHSDTIDAFLTEANIDMKNDWYFNTALELSKQENLIFFNNPDIDYLIIISPDVNMLTKNQKIFIDYMENELMDFKNIAVSIYNKEHDDFISYEKNEQDIIESQTVFVKK